MTDNAIQARITAVHKERYELSRDGEIFYGRLKSSVYYGGADADFPTTGDYVLIRYIEGGDSLILQTLPRRTFFSRRDPTPGRGEQAVAANFDTVFITASLNHDLNLKRIERYLTLAWQSGAVPVILLTKADLTEDCTEQINAVKQIAIGVEVLAVSALTGFGLDALTEYLKPGSTVVFLGSSGVGKSSLVNALSGDSLMAVNDIREDDSRGRHTTTHRQLLNLPNGAAVIDTPGMRELGMWDVRSGLGGAFAEVEQFFGNCRFPDCRHETEPGCAVKEAISNGELPRERWESYRKLKHEAKYSDDKIGFMRERREWSRAIAKQQKQKKR
jgi:ribosome biogenesis GTPase